MACLEAVLPWIDCWLEVVFLWIVMGDVALLLMLLMICCRVLAVSLTTVTDYPFLLEDDCFIYVLVVTFIGCIEIFCPCPIYSA